ncbi:hypothetical protein D9M68_872900 [compost metagenome]
MAGEKTHELADVAPIGLKRIGRQTLYGTQFAHPVRDLGLDKGIGGKGAIGHGSETIPEGLPISSARLANDRRGAGVAGPDRSAIVPAAALAAALPC